MLFRSLLLVLLNAVPQAALAGQWFRCRHDGETRSTCCCGNAAPEDGAARGPELRRTPCCDVLRNEPAAMTARPETRGDVRVATATGQAAGLPASPASIDALSAAARMACGPAPRATAPPGIGQPLYLSHSSLLL